MNEEILIPISLFGGIAVILWKYFDARHRERMTIIEKGLISEDLKHLYSGFGWKTNPYSALKYGMLAAFIGMGILASALIAPAFPHYEEQVTIGIVFLFGGIGLILFYQIVRKKMEEEKQQ